MTACERTTKGKKINTAMCRLKQACIASLISEGNQHCAKELHRVRSVEAQNHKNEVSVRHLYDSV